MNKVVPEPAIVLLDKPEGESSFHALGVVKRSLGTRKVGHCGTLDPFASGLLIALVGPATRLAPSFTGLDKHYKAKMILGAETDTLDPEGKVIHTAKIPSSDDIQRVLKQFLGTIEQVPPAYSAVKIDGQRAYSLARKGMELLMKARTVTISHLEIIRYDPPVLIFETKCSSGTYIRSLARDLALAAGSRGYLTELERLSIGPFHRSEVAESRESGTLYRTLSVLDGLKKIAPVQVIHLEDSNQEGRLRSGQMGVVSEQLKTAQTGSFAVIQNQEGELVAVAVVEETGPRFLFVLTKLQ